MFLSILKLVLAHIIGDFFLQPKKWVKDKEKKKLKSVWLYVHVAIHVALMFLFVWDLSYTTLILTIGLSHFIIDGIKLIVQRKKTKRLFFFIDQLLHLIVLLVLSFLFYRGESNFSLKHKPSYAINDSMLGFFNNAYLHNNEDHIL